MGVSGPSHLFLEPFLWEPGLASAAGWPGPGRRPTPAVLEPWRVSAGRTALLRQAVHVGHQREARRAVSASPWAHAPPPTQHYLCCSDVPVPRISVVFSLEELKGIEKDCAAYVGRMERVARHSSVSKEEKVRAPQPGLPWHPPPLLPGWAGR